jgi:hypothetical protein
VTRIFKFGFEAGAVPRRIEGDILEDENTPETLRGKRYVMFLDEGQEVPDCISLEKRVIPSDAPLLLVPDGLVRCAGCDEFKGIIALRDLPQLQGQGYDPDTPLRVQCICDGIPCPRCNRNHFHKPGTCVWSKRGGIAYIPEWRGAFPCDECNEQREAHAAEVRKRKIAERPQRLAELRKRTQC